MYFNGRIFCWDFCSCERFDFFRREEERERERMTRRDSKRREENNVYVGHP